MFTPYEVRPTLRNSGEIQKALLDRYPQRLKDTGIGGVAVIWIYIDREGKVTSTKIVKTSGSPDLDGVALQVMEELGEFSPAYNRDLAIPVWIQMPITFEATVAKYAG
jgi:TonB family protein